MNDLLLLHTNASNTDGIWMVEAMYFVRQVMEVGLTQGCIGFSASHTPHVECYTGESHV